ncbi:MAG: PA14 domain-containing protein, partial [Gemmatimonadota bacterium]|nr:PA14 domain-containing protein [Gemmatimonadota bacterium]
LTLEPTARLTLAVPLAGAEIRYTLDGSDPTSASTRYTGPFDVAVTPDGVRVIARAFTAEGKASPPRAATFRRTAFRDASPIEASLLRAGLRYTYAEATVRSAAAVDTLPSTRQGVAPAVARLGDERPEQYAIRFDGFLAIPEDGLYEFGLSSDDGSTLVIGDEIVVDNDGFHGTAERAGMVALRAGLHPVVVRYFQAGGGSDLALRVRRDGAPWQSLPPGWLRHRP